MKVIHAKTYAEIKEENPVIRNLKIIAERFKEGETTSYDEGYLAGIKAARYLVENPDELKKLV